MGRGLLDWIRVLPGMVVRVDIGITWETDNTRKQALAELLTAVQSIYPSAKSNPRWKWVYATLRSPAPDWSKPDVLVANV